MSTTANTATDQNYGSITQIIGSTFDVEYPENRLPAIYNAVKISSAHKGVRLELTGEVQQHLGGGRVRCVALGSTDGLMRGLTSDRPEDFESIEQRLGYLFYEMDKSTKETQLLQQAVAEFHQDVGQYTPIGGDDQIIAAGNLIRTKLKAIIDKQFVVDEVLDDLIRLSKLVNKRIDDLDVIEAGRR